MTAAAPPLPLQAADSESQLEELHVSGCPFDRGLAIGRRFASKMARRVAEAPGLHDRLLPFVNDGSDGTAIYDGFVSANR